MLGSSTLAQPRQWLADLEVLHQRIVPCFTRSEQRERFLD